jgi:3-hydroxybutyryl-CoA dehydratase
MMKSKSVEEINLGDSAEFARKISDNDLIRFVEAIGDLTSAGVDETHIPINAIKEKTVSEMLSAGLISTVLHSYLPGPCMRYLSQTLYFRQPVFVGDTITVRVTVTDKSEKEHWIELKTICMNQRGHIVIDGTASVLLPRN